MRYGNYEGRWGVRLLSRCSIVVTLVSTVAVCSSSGVQEDDRSGENAALAFAYITPDELVVMRDRDVISSLPGVFADGEGIVWTHSGNFVALLTNPPIARPEDRELVSVDVRSGAQNRRPCTGCVSIAAIGDDAVITSTNEAAGREDEFTFRRVDLTTSEAGADLSLDTDPGFDLSVATRSHILVSRYKWNTRGHEYDQPSSNRVQLLNASGQDNVHIGQFEANYFMTAAESIGGDGGDRVAISSLVSVGTGRGCDQLLDISVLDRDGAVVPTPSISDYSPIRNGFAIDDLWWGSDGNLHTTLTPSLCAVYEPAAPLKPFSLWTLDLAGMKWVADNAPPAKMVRYIGRGSAVLLEVADCDTPPDIRHRCATGTVSRYENGQKSPIAQNALSILAQPAPRATRESAPAFPTDVITPSCPTTSRSGEPAEIRIVEGPITCAGAQRIYSEYTHSDKPPQGSGAFIETAEWSCGFATIGTTERTGRIGSCSQPGADLGWVFEVVQAR